MVSVILLLICVAVAAASLLVLKNYRYEKNNPLKIFNGPESPSWLFGSFREIMKDSRFYHRKWLEDFGGEDQLVHYKAILGKDRVLVGNPEVLKQILVTNVYNYTKPPATALEYAVGEGLLFSEGELHDTHRRMIQPSFYHRELQDMVPKFLSKAQLLVQRWNTLLEQNNGKLRVDITAEMTLLTLDVLSSTMFGYDLNGLSATQDNNSERAELLHAFNEVLGYFDVKPQHLIPSYVKYVPTPENIRFKKNLSKVREILYRIIEEKRNSLDPEAKAKDLLDTLIRARDSESGVVLTNKQLFDHTLTFFLAGHETTSVGLTWAFEALSKHPEIEQKLADEINKHFAGKDLTAINPEEIDQVPYLNNFMKEILRFYAPVPVTIRRSVNEDTWLGKYKIPAHTYVVIPIAALHFSKRYWDNPDTFNPDRWDSQQNINNFIYMPFLTGGRGCIGNKFALEESKAALIVLLQKFRLRIAPGHQYTSKIRITTRPVPNLLMDVNKI